MSSKTIVFVHGAWGGGWDYKTMEKLLEEADHKVYRTTLTGLGEREHLNSPEVNLDTHIMDVVNVFKFEELDNVVLVGHSYGGMVITGVADKISEKIAHTVYVDAVLPESGESFFDIMPAMKADTVEIANKHGDGWKIPVLWENAGKDVAHPIATFKQPIFLSNPKTKDIPSTYVLAIDPGAETDPFSPFAERAKKRGWKYFEFQTDHNLQRTMPKELAKILMDIKVDN